MKMFSYDGPFARIMGRVFDMVLLHILWVVTSLPILTIGASTTALFSITMKMQKNEESYVLKGYIKSFRQNLKKATILWVIVVVSFLWIFFLMRICMKGTHPLLGVLGIANAALLFIVFLAVFYVFPIQAFFENTVCNILKNAIICSLKYLPDTLAMAAIVIIPILITGFVSSVFPVMIALWMAAGSSLMAYGISYFMNRVFQKVS